MIQDVVSAWRSTLDVRHIVTPCAWGGGGGLVRPAADSGREGPRRRGGQPRADHIRPAASDRGARHRSRQQRRRRLYCFLVRHRHVELLLLLLIVRRGRTEEEVPRPQGAGAAQARPRLETIKLTRTRFQINRNFEKCEKGLLTAALYLSST